MRIGALERAAIIGERLRDVKPSDVPWQCDGSPLMLYSRSESERWIEFLHGDVVLSRLPRAATATDTPLDFVAAWIAAFAPPGDIGVLGFGAGGIVGPLRAAHVTARVRGVDLSVEGEAIFREVAREWSGRVDVEEIDAVRWLECPGGRFGAVFEDLSVVEDGEVVKPWECVVAIPHLVREVLVPRGLAISNVLPWPSVSTEAVLGNVAAPHADALAATFEDWENVVLVAGESLPGASHARAAIEEILEALGSTIAGAFTIRPISGGAR